MKRFLRDLGVFFGVFGLLFHAYPEFQYWTKRYQTDVACPEVYQVWAASKSKLKKNKLVIGDSVASRYWTRWRMILRLFRWLPIKLFR